MQCQECGRTWTETAKTGRPRKYCSRSCQGRAYRRRRDEGRLSRTSRRLADNKWPTTTLEAAVSLADNAGINAVTLRAVAARADLPLTALQRDFGSRDRMVESMIQYILSARAKPTVPDDDPATALIRLAEHEWRDYRAHPWLVRVMASTRPPLVPAVLEASRGAIDVFTSLGLGHEAALGRYLAFSAYIQGMGLLLLAEHEETLRTGTSSKSWWTQEFHQLTLTGAFGKHPWLSELADQSGVNGFDATTCFRDGLHRVVAGLISAQ